MFDFEFGSVQRRQNSETVCVCLDNNLKSVEGVRGGVTMNWRNGGESWKTSFSYFKKHQLACFQISLLYLDHDAHNNIPTSRVKDSHVKVLQV